MTVNYKLAFYALLVALVVAWAVSVEVRTRQAQSPAASQADTWLFVETNVTDEAGQQLSRAGLLDRLITASVQADAAAAAAAAGGVPDAP